MQNKPNTYIPTHIPELSVQRGPTFRAASVAATGSQMITLLKMALEYDNHRQDTCKFMIRCFSNYKPLMGARVSSVSGLRTLQIKPFSN